MVEDGVGGQVSGAAAGTSAVGRRTEGVDDGHRGGRGHCRRRGRVVTADETLLVGWLVGMLGAVALAVWLL